MKLSLEDEKKVYKVQLDLLLKLREVCDNNNIIYFLARGVLLGAVRNNGFESSGFDINVHMLRRDYEKLREIADKEFQYPYFLQTMQSDTNVFTGGSARLRNSNTTFVSSTELISDANQGIYINILILDYYKDSEYQRTRQLRKIRFYQRLLYTKVYINRNLLDELNTNKFLLYKRCADFLNIDFIKRRIDKFSTSSKPSKSYTSFDYNITHINPTIYPVRLFQSFSYLNFMGEEFKVPAMYKEALRIVYGDNYLLANTNEIASVKLHKNIIDPNTPYKQKLDNLLRDKELLKNDLLTKEIAKKSNIIVYGNGLMLSKFLKNETSEYQPIFIISDDANEAEKSWNSVLGDYEIKPTSEIHNIPEENRVVIICSKYYENALEVLSSEGINKCYIYCGTNFKLEAPTKYNKYLLCINGEPVTYRK